MSIAPEIIREIKRLEMLAVVNEAYANAMEKTTARSRGLFGHIHAPCKYGLHVAVARASRMRLASLLEEHGLELIPA